jgi:hypothetical protein
MARTSQAVSTGSLGAKSGTTGAMRLSHELEGWLRGDGDKTLGGLIDLFEERSFAILFLFLLGPSALPLPTGGVTQVLEVIAILLVVLFRLGALRHRYGARPTRCLDRSR